MATFTPEQARAMQLRDEHDAEALGRTTTHGGTDVTDLKYMKLKKYLRENKYAPADELAKCTDLATLRRYGLAKGYLTASNADAETLEGEPC